MYQNQACIMYQNQAYHFSYNLTQQKHNANLALHEYKQRWVMEPISSIHYTYYNVFHLINVSFFITNNVVVYIFVI